MQQTLRRMDRGTLTVVGVALAIVCFLAVNLFSTLELGAARLDERVVGIVAEQIEQGAVGE